MKRMTAGALLVLLLSAACRRHPAPEPGEPMLDAIRAEQGGSGLSFSERQGRRLFSQYCATCHGDDGRADGQNVSNLKPPPPDLTDAARRTGADTIRKVIAEGSAAVGRSPLSPPWARSLSEEQIDDLVAFCQVLARRKP